MRPTRAAYIPSLGTITSSPNILTAREDHPDIRSADAQQRRQAFLAICVVGLLVLAGFSVINYVASKLPAMWVNIVMALLVIGGALALLSGVEDRKVYRCVCGGIGIGFYLVAAIGPGHLYYHLVLPLLMFFLVGRREGLVWSGGFLFGLIVLFVTGLIGSHIYPTGQAVRFLSCYLFVMFFGWKQATSQERFSSILMRKNEQLQEEQKQTKEALSQVTRTERQLEQTITELLDRTRLMETVFNNMDEGVAVSDAEGGMLFFNPSAERIIGLGVVESEPDEWSDIYGAFYPDQQTRVPTDQLPLVRALRGETTDGLELFVRNEKNTAGSHVRAKGRFVADNDGADNKVTAGVVVFSDITEHKKQEARLEKTINELREQSQLMEAMFNSVSDGVVVTDTEGGFLFVNPIAERIVGMGATESPADQWSETYGTFYPDGKKLFPSEELPLARAMRGESVDDVELLIRNRERPDGVYISVNARPLRDEAGEMKGGIIVLRDVTKMKKTESELRQTILSLQNQTQFMETILNSISDGVVVADEKGNFTHFNPSAERIVGIGSTDTSPDQWSDQYGIFFPDRETLVPTEEVPLVRALRGQSTDEMNVFIRNPEVPEGVYLSVSGRPLRDDDGEAKGGVVVFRDVTEHMLAEEALTQAFSQGRLEIVDTILHNIGNAINSVAIGVGTVHEQLTKNASVRRLSSLAKALEAHRGDWISYLQRDPQGQKVMPFILALADDFAQQNAQLKQTIERVDDRVTHIVDIIRTQKSLENEAMTRKLIDLREAVADAVKMLQESIAKRGARIQIDCENAPKEIRIQESRFNQMLVNLIKNGVEAIDDLANASGLREQPYIRIRAYVQEDFLVLDVTDNGIGIETKVARLIFSAGYTTKRTGSGLGLHSTANFVIGSGGKIQPLSDGLGKGTTMRVKLRLSSVTPQPESHTPRGEEAGSRPETGSRTAGRPMPR